MKDFFHRYHKHKVLTQVGILSLSAILAISANMFLLDGNTGAMLKANVLQATQKEIKTDFYGTIQGESLQFQNSKNMMNVIELSYSLTYDPELIEILSSESSFDFQTEIFESSPGFSTIIMRSETPIEITENNIISSHTFSKKIPESTGIINIVNVNFTDSNNENFLLTTEGLIF